MKRVASLMTLAAGFALAACDSPTALDDLVTPPSFAADVVVEALESPAIIVRVPNTFLPGIGAAGNIGGAPGGPARCQDVQNSNHFILSCQGVVTNLAGRGVTNTEETSNATCNAAFGQGFVVADSFRYTVSASGRASLSCTFRK